MPKFEMTVRKFDAIAYGPTLRTTLDCERFEDAVEVATSWRALHVEVIVRTDDGLTQWRSVHGDTFVHTAFKPVVLTS